MDTVTHVSVLWTCFIMLLGITKAFEVEIQTKLGTIAGFEDYVMIDNRVEKVNKFLGIPFGETTAGANRFEKPKPKPAFTGTFSAKSFGPACFFMYADKSSQGISEDCLSLNIYVPGSISSSTKPLPVMIWVYGGSFVWGKAANYQPEALATFGDVIVVTINYRLEMFGFFRSNDGRFVGNQGLWDQHLAFKWVHDNIASFNGDPNNVTIFGESSGGVSVSLQALYPGNKGLFHRVIAESGSAFEYWSVYGPNAEKIISKLSCDLGNTATCLKQKTALEIQSVQWLVNYGPVVDGDFLVEMPTYIIFGNNSISDAARQFYSSLDILTGMCRYDGALYILDIWPFNNLKSKENVTVTQKLFTDTIIPKLVDDVYAIKDTKARNAVIEAVKFEYTDWNDPDNDVKRRSNVIEMTLEASFFAAQIKTLHGRSMMKNSRSYFFEFAVNSTKHMWSHPPSWAPVGSYHGDEIPYVFGYPISNASDPKNYTSAEKQVSRAVMTMWTNFAKTGNPNHPTSLNTYFTGPWPEYKIASPSYLVISDSMSADSVKSRFHAREMAFWLKYIPQVINSYAETATPVFNPSLDLIGDHVGVLNDSQRGNSDDSGVKMTVSRVRVHVVDHTGVYKCRSLLEHSVR